jgi:peptide/nickel transport system substrate-binding protein
MDGRFDPTGEYLGTAWGMMDQLLIRGLMTYKHVDAASGGDTPVPDIATGPPTVSADQLTYDFTLKDNVMWAPPLSRAVTADDVLYAFQRINDKKLVAQYGNYYCGVIKGMDCAAKDDNQRSPASPSPTPRTSPSRWTSRRATCCTGSRCRRPSPFLPRSGDASRIPGDYGVDLISSGPYMIMGQDKLNLSSCSTIKPISGYNVDKGMTMVRNPNWDAATDDTRHAYADGIQIKINSNVDDSFNALENGDLDVVQGTPPVAVLQDFETNPDFQGWLHADQGDRTWYVTMNLLAPPFDDIHVRNAVNLALDKAGIRKAYGGDKRGELATSVEPPTVLPQSQDINPFTANTGAGDATAAMDEMKQSRYDTNKNGICD